MRLEKAWSVQIRFMENEVCSASELGLCYQFYHYRSYQFGPGNYGIGLISFVPITYQRCAWGKPRKLSKPKGAFPPRSKGTFPDGKGRTE